MAKATGPALSQTVEEVARYIRAAHPCIWVQCIDSAEFQRELIFKCEAMQTWAFCDWDADEGLKGDARVMNQRSADEIKKEPVWYDKKPVSLIKDAHKIAAKTKQPRTIFVLKNFHRKEFMENTAILQALINSARQAQQAEKFSYTFIVLSPLLCIPAELESEFVVVEQALPDRPRLWSAMSSIAQADELPKTEEERQMVLDAAVGLSVRAAEGALALTIVDKKPFDVATIQKHKAQAVKRSGLLTISSDPDTFEQMGGLSHFKDYTAKLLRRRPANPLLNPKGLLLLGVPGSGKSQAVKCLGNATNRPVLCMDVGALRSKYQGETDQNMRNALRIADAMSPCILFIDEIEKALSGVQSSGVTDGGTGARVFGTLLTWLNDHKSDVFFVGTCNDVGQLMGSNPEFARAERFDGMFFFDLPSQEERLAIWNIYLKAYDIKKAPDSQKLIEMSKDWTGAEIRQCCRLSALMDETIEVTATKIVPIMKTGKDKLDELRDWADGLCLSASTHGLFKKEVDANIDKMASDISSRRKGRTTKSIDRSASNNEAAEPVSADK